MLGLGDPAVSADCKHRVSHRSSTRQRAPRQLCESELWAERRYEKTMLYHILQSNANVEYVNFYEQVSAGRAPQDATHQM
jgi:hypothetical protein